MLSQNGIWPILWPNL